MSVDASQTNRAKLVEGTFLGLDGTDRVMLLDTQEVQDGVLKVSGKTLDEFLNTRLVILDNNINTSEYAIVLSPGAAMNQLVYDAATVAGYLAGAAPFGINAGFQTIANLQTTAAAAGAVQTFSAKRGPLFDAIKEIGQATQTGWKMVPNNVTPSSYTIDFSTYNGRNLCSDQNIYGLVRFSPSLESLTNVKELKSIAGYRTLCYAISPGFDAAAALAGGSQYTGLGQAYPGAVWDTGFSRRTMIVEIRDITAANVNNSFTTYKAVMDGYARDALANNNYVKAVDGEIVPQNQYKFGTDYLLGDIVELQDQFDFIQKARVTEYIRTQDANGSREYPTISVL